MGNKEVPRSEDSGVMSSTLHKKARRNAVRSSKMTNMPISRESNAVHLRSFKRRTIPKTANMKKNGYMPLNMEMIKSVIIIPSQHFRCNNVQR